MLLSQRDQSRLCAKHLPVNEKIVPTFQTEDELREAMIALDGGKSKLPQAPKENEAASIKRQRLQNRRDALRSFIATRNGVRLGDIMRAFPTTKKNTIRGDLQALTKEGRIASKVGKNRYRIWRVAA